MKYATELEPDVVRRDGPGPSRRITSCTETHCVSRYMIHAGRRRIQREPTPSSKLIAEAELIGKTMIKVEFAAKEGGTCKCHCGIDARTRG